VGGDRFVRVTDTPPAAPEVGVDELAQAMEEGAVVVDVRELDEYVRAHVPGVQLLPLSEFEQRWQEIPSDGPVYVICGSGPRSMRAAIALRQAGVDAINVAGGTRAWVNEGRPVETGQP
jgi:rhodanese-related sulfurtransferase